MNTNIAAEMIAKIQMVGESSRTANNKDLLDETPISFGENVRVLCIEILTEQMRENSVLATDVNSRELAARAQNHTCAEIEVAVQSAWSFALLRSLRDPKKPVDEKSIEVTMDDFMNAFEATTDELGRRSSGEDKQEERVIQRILSQLIWRLNGMVSCGDRHKHIYKKIMLLVEQVRVSMESSLVTCLLEGPSGSGKTALAATVGIDSGFPCVKFVSAETMIKLDERDKRAEIVKVFEDAYKSSSSIVILDDLERLMEYVAIGPQFSELISQTLLDLLKQRPPEGKKLLVIGTTSKVSFLRSVGVCDAFSFTDHVPALKTVEVKEVLEQLNVFSEDDVHAAAEALNDVPIKKLYMLIEMAAQVERGGAAEAIPSGREKIKIAHFYDFLQDNVR